MILSFKDAEAERLFEGKTTRRLPANLQRGALRKLLMLDAAVLLGDLKVPPGNKLESLKSRRLGQYSIRINKQWRVCFEWRGGNAISVEIVDYH